MTVSEASSRTALFVGDDSQVDFLFTFRVLSDEDLLVYMLDTDTDVTTLLTKDVDYTVTLTSLGVLGGKITMLVPPTTLERIRIYRDTPLDQEVDIPSQGNFTPSVVNAALDKEVLALQEMKERTDRAIVVEPMSSDTPEELVAEMRAAIVTADTALAVANAALPAAIVYLNAALAGLVSGGAITATIWNTTVTAGDDSITTPYSFTKGVIAVGGTWYNLAVTTDGASLDNTGAATIINFDDPFLVDKNAMLIVFS